jgi:hypothetical protein
MSGLMNYSTGEQPDYYDGDLDDGYEVRCDACDARETVEGEITERTLEDDGWYLGHDDYALCPDHNEEGGA